MDQRSLYKLEAIHKRGGFAVEGYYPKCDYCKQRVGSQMHELIARSITQGNPEARALSYQAPLVSLLCMTQKKWQLTSGH